MEMAPFLRGFCLMLILFLVCWAHSTALLGALITLKDMQCLLGRLNDFMQMAPFLKGFGLTLTLSAESVLVCGNST